jgi:hypothetical protein
MGEGKEGQSAYARTWPTRRCEKTIERRGPGLVSSRSEGAHLSGRPPIARSIGFYVRRVRGTDDGSGSRETHLRGSCQSSSKSSRPGPSLATVATPPVAPSQVTRRSDVPNEPSVHVDVSNRCRKRRNLHLRTRDEATTFANNEKAPADSLTRRRHRKGTMAGKRKAEDEDEDDYDAVRHAADFARRPYRRGVSSNPRARARIHRSSLYRHRRILARILPPSARVS